MVSAFFGASSTLAARLGVGRRVFSASHGHLLLDRWGFALDLGAEPAGRCVDTWRTCHDAFTAVMYADLLRAGIAGRAEPHSLSSLTSSRRRSPARSAGGARASCQMPCWSALRQPTRREGMACTAPCTIARRCSTDVHALLRETATAAAAREWRECGASSHGAARAAYISILRRRWGCTAELAGARLRLSRAYLAGGDDHDAADAGDAAAGFDFSDAARMAAEFAPILAGPPPGSVAIN